MKKEEKIIKYSNGGFQIAINLLYDPKYPIIDVVRLVNVSLEKVTRFYSAYGNSLDLSFPIDLLYRRAEYDEYFEYKTERWGSGCCRKGNVALFHPDFFEIETSHKREDFPKTLTHEISHMFDKKIFGENYLWWVHEGVAQYVANQTVLKKIEPENINHFIANNLYNNNNYHDFTKQSGHQISKRLAFAIVDNYSEKALFELLKIEPGKNSKQIIATILKVPQEEIEKTIRAFLVEEKNIDQKYVDSQEYQNEIAQQYKERVSKFTREQVVEVLEILNMPNLPAIDEIVEAGAGNVNATYIAKDFVVKLNQKKGHPDYLANKIVSDRLGAQSPVVHVLAYDDFEKTPFEVLVMERSKGAMLLDDIIEMSEQDREIIFQQVLDTINHLFEIKFSDFGWVNLEGKESYLTYAEFLSKEFNEHVSKIRAEKLCAPEDIDKIEAYFKKHISIFDSCESVFIHTDTHMGNILHEGTKLTALIDFDYSLKAPKVRALNSLLGFIGYPQQYVEGTKDFPEFKGKNFYHLLPILKSKFPEIFADPQLLRKLNLIGIKEGVMWVSQNWSANWNAEMIKGLIENELPEDDFSQTYYGKILLNQKK